MSPLLITGFVALLLNAAYLAAGPDATLLYYTNVALHPALGLGLGAALLGGWRRPGAFDGGVARLALVLLGLALLSGVGILILGAGRAQAPLVIAHVWVSLLGAGVFALYIWQRVAPDMTRPWAVRLALLACMIAAQLASRSDAEADEAQRPPSGPADS